MTQGGLYILSAPSGAGKTTLIRTVLDRALEGSGQPYFAVSCTTRRPRPGEVEGRHYTFSTRDAFERLIEEGAFLEWAEVFGNYYGTPNSEVLPHIERGRDVILDIDVQGAESILRAHRGAPDSPLRDVIRTIFVLPPSPEALSQRIRTRRSEDDQATLRRLGEAAREIGKIDLYDYVIVNDDLDAASRALASIILEGHSLEGHSLEGSSLEGLSRAHPLPENVSEIVEAFHRFEERAAGRDTVSKTSLQS